LASVTSGNVQSEHVAVGEIFIQRYYRNFNTLNLCWPVLHSGNDQCEHVAGGVNFHKKLLSEN